MTQQHTPGPWDLHLVTTKAGHNKRAVAAPGMRICDVSVYTETDDANARLIAAAPELLAALAEPNWAWSDLLRAAKAAAPQPPALVPQDWVSTILSLAEKSYPWTVEGLLHTLREVKSGKLTTDFEAAAIRALKVQK